MAIELVTGLPGHGKTLYTIARFRDVAQKQGRPVFYNGITGLKLPWQQWEVERWEELPAGAIFIIDEAWKCFPVRGRRDDNAPDHIRNLAVHRHKGIDIVLIAQNPLLIDAFVRRLIDRHWHVVRAFGTRNATLHEYPTGVRELVAKSRGDSIKHQWRYPADVFELYESAEVHTVQRRIPMKVWILLVLPVLILSALGYAYYRLRPSAVSDRAGGPMAAASAPAAGQGLRPGAQHASVGADLSPQHFLELHQPRVPGLAYTAPVYDEVTKPTEAPYPAACVATAERCQCYTQQATRLEVPDDLCRSIAAGGFFVAWRDKGEKREQAVPRFDRPAASRVDEPGPVALGFNGERRAGLVDLLERPAMFPGPGGGEAPAAPQGGAPAPRARARR